MQNKEFEHHAQCPQCGQNYWSDLFWKVCPVCDTELEQLGVKICDPRPKIHPMVDKKVYNSADVARLMGFSIPTVKRMFKNEPGVILLERPTKMNKRRYCNIRIPRHVYERVLRRYVVQ
jgi:uncharacterized protein with PIN domain